MRLTFFSSLWHFYSTNLSKSVDGVPGFGLGLWRTDGRAAFIRFISLSCLFHSFAWVSFFFLFSPLSLSVLINNIILFLLLFVRLALMSINVNTMYKYELDDSITRLKGQDTHDRPSRFQPRARAMHSCQHLVSIFLLLLFMARPLLSDYLPSVVIRHEQQLQAVSSIKYQRMNE